MIRRSKGTLDHLIIQQKSHII